MGEARARLLDSARGAHGAHGAPPALGAIFQRLGAGAAEVVGVANKGSAEYEAAARPPQDAAAQRPPAPSRRVERPRPPPPVPAAGASPAHDPARARAPPAQPLGAGAVAPPRQPAVRSPLAAAAPRAARPWDAPGARPEAWAGYGRDLISVEPGGGRAQRWASSAPQAERAPEQAVGGRAGGAREGAGRVGRDRDADIARRVVRDLARTEREAARERERERGARGDGSPRRADTEPGGDAAPRDRAGRGSDERGREGERERGRRSEKLLRKLLADEVKRSDELQRRYRAGALSREQFKAVGAAACEAAAAELARGGERGWRVQPDGAKPLSADSAADASSRRVTLQAHTPRDVRALLGPACAKHLGQRLPCRSSPALPTVRTVARGTDGCARRPPPPRTNRTRRAPHPVLIGHAASLTPY